MADLGATINAAATDHLPWFVTAPDQGDGLMTVAGAILLFMLVMTGVLYLRLHALPEHISHRSNKIQLQIVGVLCLVALFTHNHIFWIGALLLALVDVPDFGAPLRSIARSLDRMAPPERQADPPETQPTPPPEADQASRPAEGV
jgi:hypothetical protein